ncbi:MAG: capsule assembly Wzi family protein, partial [Rhizomicrobium sp.]|nr:capsule assembly Wzi family protein [Rhizomicrobium sp.]
MAYHKAGKCIRAGLLSSATAIGSLWAFSAGASAGPWTELGDASLRSDIELLASTGVVDGIATHWPLPWAGLVDRLDNPNALAGQPDYVRAVAERLRSRGKTDTAPGFHGAIFFDGAGSPATVRGYDALGRQSLQGGAELEYIWKTTVVHLNVGARSTNKFDRQTLDLDGSYIAQRLGDTVVYAGYMPHWWGPGWMSAMSLSTNARPVPQVGFSRLSTAPFKSPWL